jgi:hypothetical protein
MGMNIYIYVRADRSFQTHVSTVCVSFGTGVLLASTMCLSFGSGVPLETKRVLLESRGVPVKIQEYH